MINYGQINGMTLFLSMRCLDNCATLVLLIIQIKQQPITKPVKIFFFSLSLFFVFWDRCKDILRNIAPFLNYLFKLVNVGLYV